MNTDSRGRPFDGAYEGRSMEPTWTCPMTRFGSVHVVGRLWHYITKNCSFDFALSVPSTDCSVNVACKGNMLSRMNTGLGSEVFFGRLTRLTVIFPVRPWAERVWRRPIFLLPPYSLHGWLLCGIDGWEKTMAADIALRRSTWIRVVHVSSTYTFRWNFGVFRRYQPQWNYFSGFRLYFSVHVFNEMINNSLYLFYKKFSFMQCFIFLPKPIPPKASEGLA